MLKENLTHTLGSLPLAGRALRWYANQYAEGSIVQIKQGHAADLLWKRHHRYVNGYWIGHYEFPIQDALKRLLKPSDTFFDLGANAGFFTLIAARLVGNEGKCVAFDPSPDNTKSISEQLTLNSLDQCTVVMEAIADFEGEADFFFASPGSSLGHLGKSKNGEQQTKVKVTTLDNAVIRFGAPNLVKMDIEGAEVQALRGASLVLKQIRPVWLIELHSARCEKEVRELLASADYEFFDLDGASIRRSQELPGHCIAKPSV